MNIFHNYLEAIHQTPERMQRYDLYVEFHIKVFLHLSDWEQSFNNLISELKKICTVISNEKYKPKYGLQEAWDRPRFVVKIKAPSSLVDQIEKTVRSTLPDHGVSFILYNINNETAGASLFSTTKRHETI